MARRSPYLDLALCAVVVACGAIAYATSRVPKDPPMPAGLVGLDDPSTPPAPHHVLAVVGSIAPAADRATLADLSRAGIATIGPFATRDQVQAALTEAIENPEIDLVYYNGHEYDGSLAIPATTKLVVLDTCWSAQEYARSPNIVANTHRSVTGSVGSFVAMLDDMRAQHSWPEILSHMNDLADRRAAIRAGLSKYEDAERYLRFKTFTAR